MGSRKNGGRGAGAGARWGGGVQDRGSRVLDWGRWETEQGLHGGARGGGGLS
jgi:hypothetical protein